jgi:hypothetical protein
MVSVEDQATSAFGHHVAAILAAFSTSSSFVVLVGYFKKRLHAAIYGYSIFN